MKLLFLSFILFPFISIAQDSIPKPKSITQDPVSKFENDTLYTSSGYKIFPGQILEFGKGTKRDGRFRYVTIKTDFLTKTLTNTTVLVKQINNYSTTVLGNAYVDLTGYITLKDGSKEFIVLHMAIDRVIENSPALPSELIVPKEFRNTRPRNINKELVTARNLYEDGVITRTEYEAMENEILK